MQLQFTPAAHADLHDIYHYISNTLMNETAANKLVHTILDDCDLLKEQPLLGPNLNNKLGVKTLYRYLISNTYMIIYKPTPESIQIIRILDTRTDYLRVLAEY